jgi:hypothetical protein
MNHSAVELIALLLPRRDREAVLGDLTESSASFGSSLFAILGFALRRQFFCWLSWRPWFAGIALAYTTTWLLMGSSVDISTSAVNWYGGPAVWRSVPYGLPSFTLALLRLIVAAWCAGFAVARISRRTLWCSLLLLLGPSFCCYKSFHVETHFDHHILQLSPFVLFLYLPLMIFGVYAGLHNLRPRPWPTLLLIVPYCVQLVPMTRIQSGTNFVLWTLLPLWPCCYLVWLALRSTESSTEAWSV